MAKRAVSRSCVNGRGSVLEEGGLDVGRGASSVRRDSGPIEVWCRKQPAFLKGRGWGSSEEQSGSCNEDEGACCPLCFLETDESSGRKPAPPQELGKVEGSWWKVMFHFPAGSRKGVSDLAGSVAWWGSRREWDWAPENCCTGRGASAGCLWDRESD